MKTKRYPHVTGLYGDEGENPGALAIHAVLDPSPNYPEAGRIIVGSPATTPTIPGYIPNLGGLSGGPDAIERLASTLTEAVRDVRAAIAGPPLSAAETEKLDLEALERKACNATPGPWTTTKPPKEDGWQLGVVIGATMAGKIYAQPPGGQMPLADLEHIAAASPEVMLALIARVRCLQIFIDAIPDEFLQAGKLGREELPELFTDEDGNALYMDEAKRRILERGTVLP